MLLLPQQKVTLNSDYREDIAMSENQRVVAVVSPWEKLHELAKAAFRIESLPAEKKVMVWRDDLPGEQELSAELRRLGIKSAEMRKKGITNWKNVD
jgi:hypothetical protein